MRHEYLTSDHSYWSNFAKTGDPNSGACGEGGLISWPQNTGPEGDYNIALDYPLRQEQGLSSSYCDFWDTVGYGDFLFPDSARP